MQTVPSMLHTVIPIAMLLLADPQTERTWKAKCATCHGVDGKGQSDQGKKYGSPDLSAAKWQSSRTDAQVRDAIANPGSVERGGQKVDLHGYKDKLRPEQIDALVGYVRGLAK